MQKLYINLSADSPESLAEEIETAFKKEFPHGFVKTKVHTSGIFAGDIHVHLGAIDDDSLLQSRIRDNDPMRHSFLITKEGETLVATLSHGAISVKPESKMYVMDKVKTKWRKTRGDSKKILKAFTVFFKRLHALWLESEERIYRREVYPNKYFK